ncbi:HNH endonuclease family protein [Kineococcus siccus]|uniref:HNH endonuclease family protein n=1 Tax=Kineococcus siccus TaxID=2696567 RepID=UPI0030B7FB7B
MRQRGRSGAAAAILVPLLLVVLVVVVLGQRGGERGAPSGGSAVAALAELEVAPEGSSRGYQRDRFGPSWADVDGNGCSTRDDVLRRDLTRVRTREGGCVVLSGTLDDPYSDAVISFRRGADTSADVQVDHVVALADAWRTGASEFSDEDLREFANDPLELLAVDGTLNSAKGDDDAAQWLPPEGACPYVARQIAVKRAWGLWVTPAEHDAMAEVLAGCPGERLPTS